MLIHSKIAARVRKIALNRLQSYEKFPTPPSSAASFRRHFSGDNPRKIIRGVDGGESIAAAVEAEMHGGVLFVESGEGNLTLRHGCLRVYQ